MTTLNNARQLKRYLLGTHHLREIDAEIMIKLLHKGTHFFPQDVIVLCKDMNVKNYEREAYNILTRLEKENLIWKNKLNVKEKHYERITVDFLQKELEENLEGLKEELVQIAEQRHYSPDDPFDDVKSLSTEREIINSILELRNRGFNCKIKLRYKSNMPVVGELESYKRFMKKLRNNSINFEVGGDGDVILAEGDGKSFITILCRKYEEAPALKFNFYGIQLVDEALHTWMKGLQR